MSTFSENHPEATHDSFSADQSAKSLPHHDRKSLSSLLKKIKPSMLHGEIDTGDPVGKEIW